MAKEQERFDPLFVLVIAPRCSVLLYAGLSAFVAFFDSSASVDLDGCLYVKNNKTEEREEE